MLRKIWFAHLYSNKLSFECPAERYLSSIKLEKEGDIAATLLAFFTNGLRHAYVNKLTFAGVDFTVVCDVISALESSQEVVILEFDSIDFRDDAASAFHDAVFSVPYLIYLTICDCRTPHSFITDVYLRKCAIEGPDRRYSPRKAMRRGVFRRHRGRNIRVPLRPKATRCAFLR